MIALEAEAKPIINKLNLYRVNDFLDYAIYKDEIGSNWLVVSGVGQKNVTAAAFYLERVSSATPWSVWVNVGIAGSSRRRYGDLFVIDKVTKASNNERLFPGTVIKTDLPKAQLLTVDEPKLDYQDIDLVDMEGAEFFKVTSKMSCRELVRIMKVVSDGPNNSVTNLGRKAVSELITKNLSLILEEVEKVNVLASIERHRFIIPPEYEGILQRWYFTVAQTYELRKLIQKLTVAFPTTNFTEKVKGLKSSREVIIFLKRYLDDYEIDWNSA